MIYTLLWNHPINAFVVRSVQICVVLSHAFSLRSLKQNTYFRPVTLYCLLPLGACVTGTGVVGCVVTPSGNVTPVGWTTAGGTDEGGVPRLKSTVVGRTNVTSRHSAANSTAEKNIKSKVRSVFDRSVQLAEYCTHSMQILLLSYFSSSVLYSPQIRRSTVVEL